MKKIGLALITLMCLIMAFQPLQALAGDNSPVLNSISFKNGDIDNGFKSNKHEYSITLKDSSVSPTLKSYDVKGNADIFVTYNYDDTKHQTGLTVTLQYETGSTIYNFNYANPNDYAVNNNNLLESIYCPYGELSTPINDNDTAYKLYIPSDLTSLKITPITKDINAYCAPVELKLSDGQTTKITMICTASDGSKRDYSFDIKRVDKTTAQVKEEMARPDFTSFVDGTRIYQKPEFIITAVAVSGGIVLLIVFLKVTRRITVNPYDSEEKPFYSPVE